MEKEIWKDVTGYEGLYQISNLGNARSIDRLVKHDLFGFIKLKGKILSPSFGGNGYPSVNFWRKRSYKTFLIHRLVAENFIENPLNKPHINHKNCDKTDCSLENLEWCTHHENMIHASKNGLMGRKYNKTKTICIK